MESALDGLYASGLSRQQRDLLHRIDKHYHQLMKISEQIACELAATVEEMSKLADRG